MTTRARAGVAAAMMILGASCTNYEYSGSRTVPLPVRHGDPRPALAIATVVDANGLEVRVQPPTCRRTVTEQFQNIVTDRKYRDLPSDTLERAASIGLAVMGIVGVGGIVGLAIADEPEDEPYRREVGYVMFGLTALVPAFVVFDYVFLPRRTRTSVWAQQDGDSHDEPIACPGWLDLPDRLQLTTPWGTSIEAPVDDGGVARFVLDWPGSALDPGATSTAAVLAGSWQLTAGGWAGTTWSPAPAEVEALQRSLIAATAAGPP